ncbi:aldehyde dehydrogenase [Streptantibioticus cattleyicolor]|uniref:Aldehyde dehydrogenase n=1 Tax=Streptantibioticus cattleyicolor (strain ATCC 35852 / DSM 46488 / JCM 4925 / NBRC 14057 / NRRL 8057) TaxID=1003195 RepID=F8JKR7_STREN|nr:aldehyde dehydrogenase [Streptantibioticus cattleyicolor]AEW98440.1 aldehyde dehydrogenase [Streptantibioticus cattleyicolor NRRL 8057 = DSM 46488]CCB72505.1 putative aldehyde dehydrogenase [Streptantibioticus cattleyicolor NRRL 8057 = DSM 46488]
MTRFGDHLYVAGGRCASDGTARLTVVNPATEQPLGRAAEGTAGDVDRAVTAARAALPDWSGRPGEERAALMEALAELVTGRAEEIAALVTAENGMPLAFSARFNPQALAHQLRYFAGLARTTPVESRRTGHAGSVLVRREAAGVAGLVVPWNYPLALIGMKLGPALAAGCTVVLKPAPETPFDALLLAELASEAGLPPGVFNVVTGGAATGRALVAHPGVGKVAFTGSTAAGRAIAKACAERLVPVTLELGGKSAAVVLADADPAAVAAGLGFLGFANAGQSCYLNSRVLVPRRRYAEFTEVLRGVAEGFRLGDPTAPETTMGPLVTARQRERVAARVEEAVAEGARLVTGGRPPKEQPTGWFYEPTVLAGVTPDMAVFREEVFGPVVAVVPYDGEDEAVALANDSRYGLAGSVWTADPEHGLELARRVETGSIGVNGWAMDTVAPFGGRKDSGLGYENGPEGLDAYVRLKSVVLPG